MCGLDIHKSRVSCAKELPTAYFNLSIRARCRALRQKQQQRYDRSGEYDRCERAAEVEADLRDWLVEKITDGGTKRSREDERGPEKVSARGSCTLSTDTLPSVRCQTKIDATTQANSSVEPPAYPTPIERVAKSAIVVPAVVDAMIVAQ